MQAPEDPLLEDPPDVLPDELVVEEMHSSPTLVPHVPKVALFGEQQVFPGGQYTESFPTKQPHMQVFGWQAFPFGLELQSRFVAHSHPLLDPLDDPPEDPLDEPLELPPPEVHVGTSVTSGGPQKRLLLIVLQHCKLSPAHSESLVEHVGVPPLQHNLFPIALQKAALELVEQIPDEDPLDVPQCGVNIPTGEHIAGSQSKPPPLGLQHSGMLLFWHVKHLPLVQIGLLSISLQTTIPLSQEILGLHSGVQILPPELTSGLIPASQHGFPSVPHFLIPKQVVN